ncbi:hypothetical protein [Streptosporangium subroseum]|uniref:hypothetical protein n=1 Tax=Streptosporangium subroseum TaxID=106412 RepID=UPI00352E8828
MTSEITVTPTGPVVGRLSRLDRGLPMWILAGVVGPLIEVPVLVGLVYVALATHRLFPGFPVPAAAIEGTARV